MDINNIYGDHDPMLKSFPNEALGGSVTDLRAFAGTFWRGRGIICACLAIFVPIGVVLALSAEPYYRSSSLLLLSSNDPQLGIPAEINFGTTPQAPMEKVSTEMRVITSRQVFLQVIDKLDLMTHPNFNPEIAERSVFEKWFPWFNAQTNALTSEELKLHAIVEKLRQAVSVNQQGLTPVIEITVTLDDAILATDVANAMTQTYIDLKEQQTQATLRSFVEWLSAQVAESGTRVETSASKVETFRVSAGLGEPVQLITLSAQLNRLNENLTNATNVRESLEVRRRDIEEGTSQDVIAQIERELQTAYAREAALRTSAEEISARLDKLTQASAQLQQLEQEAAADGLVYEHFLNQARQSSALQTVQHNGAQILEPAIVPLLAAGPSKKLFVLASLFGGGVIGVGIVFVRELVRRVPRSREELTRLTGRPVVAVLPPMPGRGKPEQLLAELKRTSNSDYSEALRRFRNSILLTPGGKSRVVGFTSYTPEEDKIVLSLSLALQTLASGHRVVILDCDQRLSRLTDHLRLTPEYGLVDVLDGTADVLDAVQVDERYGLHVVPALHNEASDPDKLMSPRFGEIINALRKNYDLVVLNIPPVAPTADVGVVASYCDNLYLLCQWNRTTRSEISDAVSQLQLLNIKVAGLVFTQVNLRREAAFRGVPYRIYKEYRYG